METEHKKVGREEPDKHKHLFFWRDKEHYLREFVSMLAKGQKKGILADVSRKMIENILEFSSLLVREIMIPRTDIIAVSSEDSLEDMMSVFSSSHYSRIPVYRGSVDNIVGIFHIQDLLKSCLRPAMHTDILAHLAKPYYIPETKSAFLLFQEFKNNKKHMAIVIDEYGGTSGLITLEDLLETIVGDIRDEYEQNPDSEEIFQTAEGAFIVDGRAEIEKIEERLDVHLEKGRFETVAGYILNSLRRIPHPGENFQIDNLDITIENAGERNIKKVKVKKIQEEDIHEK
ncbi:MAG: HlyC/CorC family transporter [Syntrophaceae bacterium]|nr:HlyC/CorC family transporter [Syntrophaceae bacterium]